MQLPGNVRGHQVQGTRVRLRPDHLRQRVRTPPAVVCRQQRQAQQPDHPILWRLQRILVLRYNARGKVCKRVRLDAKTFV